MGGPTLDAAATEFDLWADAGRAESMADGHGGVTRQAINRWNLDSSHTVLDVGCGNGWAVRELIKRGAGRGLGVDLSPKMIELAKACSEPNGPCSYTVATADKLPFADASVTHLLNVESLYYYPEPASAVAEWARVTASGGKIAILVDLYEENPATHCWIDALDIAVHLFSAPQLKSMLEAAGWTNVWSEQVLDPRPITPEADFTLSKYWPSYEAYVSHRNTGALVVHGTR